MPKGTIDHVAPATATEGLHERIRRLEIGAASLHRSEPTALLSLRSQVETELQYLEGQGRDTRAERSRLATADNMLRSGAGRIASRASRAGGLSSLRRSAAVPKEHWWWYLDEVVAEDRRTLARRFLVTLLAVAAVALVAAYALSRVGGTPEQRQAAGHAIAGDQSLQRGDNAAAIEAYVQSVTADPSQAQIWAMLAVLYEAAGEQPEADKALRHARELAPDAANLAVLLSRALERTGDYEQALSQADEALAEDPASAEAALARAAALEGLGQLDAAIEGYEYAAELALQRRQDAVYVVARTRMGMLMQQGAAGSMPGFGGN